MVICHKFKIIVVTNQHFGCAYLQLFEHILKYVVLYVSLENMHRSCISDDRNLA